MTSGTTPAGANTELQASQWVRGMFGRIAPRYDLLNHLLSFNVDLYWRRQTVKHVRTVLDRPGAVVVDLCCGTGDLALALARVANGRVLGSDFCHPMLIEAARKQRRGGLRLTWFEADALAVPLAGASCDLVTVAFGFRNLANYRDGLKELLRLLKPGGVAAILEFSQPPNPLFGQFYSFYSRQILPRLGGLISGSRDAYRYLPESVAKFPGPEQLASAMRQAGFESVTFERMTGGIVALHRGVKAE